MAIIVDDLLVRPFVGLVNTLHTMAIDELYDIDALEDERKENRLLYELGERSKGEYEERKDEIEAELELAREIHEELTSGRVEVRTND
ncbi:gas vesicle protein GvpF [Natronosalvus halobius]|uniref:gas vesicle protein GvpF n=1 Tax=Natronosalvus halobius TaxID=2953746 RepID=UPI0020A1AA49|nr:protein gvpG [Natronosalvus halobius]USZ73368.1 protein gvpG [Natronosalvus halobius]